MDQDIFDVFDTRPVPASSPASSDGEEPARPVSRPERTRRRDKGKKRKAESKSDADGDLELLPDAPLASRRHDDGAESDEPEEPDENPGHGHKRRKKDSAAAPVLTDEFQTAASREIAQAAGFAEDEVEDEGGSGGAAGQKKAPAAAKDGSALVLSHNIQHQVALPPDLGYEYVPLSEHQAPEQPARTWPFKLDPFQSLSVASIERDESVLVSAHTSAGKTVVAEYAIAQCLRRNQRVIYTSPIKALSNQKYRDFNETFGDVGLMTGDVTINPTASCLVMTTEILRSMLYRGSEIMREVAWVVFDEIHYMRDKVRGVVWEETIILLPDKVRYVFLSATIPNAFQFAEWIAKIHHQACHVVYTDFRPTPLQNYFFPSGARGIFLVVDEKGAFKEHNFNLAMRAIEENGTAEPGRGGGGGRGGAARGRGGGGAKGTAAEQRAPITRVITNIMKRSYHPVIVFSFSKREVEGLALAISHLRFTDDSEKELVRRIFKSAIESLPEPDRELPQIVHILPLLERGIGVHHSGLLPILKETIEILFQESLIKVLFATETFSIGLNMPAKTVVFTQVKKFDGTTNRPITPSEYVQMAGRAGRRGLDARGIVIMMVDDKMDPDVFRHIVVGQQDRLDSAFHLGYNMVLNLLRIEAISPEFMLERCFYQFQNAAAVPALERELTSLQRARDGVSIADEPAIKDYYTIRRQLNTYHRDMRAVIQQPANCAAFLQPGRLVQIFDPSEGGGDGGDGDGDAAADADAILESRDYGWGVVVSLDRRRGKNTATAGGDGKGGGGAGDGSEFPPQESYIVNVFLPVAAESVPLTLVAPVDGDMPPVRSFSSSAEAGNGVRHDTIPCLLTCIKNISQVRVFLPKQGLTSDRERETVVKALSEVRKRFPDGLPILDPLENMGITDDGFKKLLRKIEVLESRLLANPLHGSPLLPELWEQFHRKARLGDQIRDKRRAIARAHSVAQLDELKARKRVLRRLGFISDAEVVQLKGRAACEISSSTEAGHELLLAELLFDRFFNELTAEACAAVLSVFVFDERMTAEPLKEELDRPFRQVMAKARVVVKVSQECKIELDEKQHVESLRWQLMETVHAWALGGTFLEICKMTSAYEGSIIRVFRRLEELLRQMAQAAKVMGSDDLVTKFEEALNKIKRDMVAAQSLYL